ncbi:MAG: xanthine dehydrogenase family protein, partial [Chloroflexi bacterium]|nr:xanthine dehydrogenase family protein [Chloroflexota bacterium]
MQNVVGQHVPRLDGRAKVMGVARYVEDLHIERMLHARLVLADRAHARIAGVDASAARAVPGCLGVLTARDLPLPGYDAADRLRSPLALDEVVFAGQPVAVVVATSAEAAADALERVRVAYEPLLPVLDPLAALDLQSPPARSRAEGEGGDMALHAAVEGGGAEAAAQSPNVASTVRYRRGDVAQGLAEADEVVKYVFTTPMVYQGYLEPHAALAVPEPDGRLTIYTSTQALFHVRDETAAALGLPAHHVRVVPMAVGGGFGAKIGLLEPLVAAVALRLGRPVTLVRTRLEDLRSATPSPAARFEVTLGARRDGTLTALQARVIFDPGGYAGAPLAAACTLLGGTYRVPHLDIAGYEVLTNKLGQGAYRAPGAPQAMFALESCVDELARRLGIDPLAFRMQNAVDGGDPMLSGRPWPPLGLRACLEALAPYWQAGPRSSSAGGRTGRGLAIGGWFGGLEPAAASCRVNRDGSVTVIVGAVDISGTATGLAQIAAEVLGVDLGQVEVVVGDSDSAPQSGGSSGSKITYTVGRAVLRAAEDARAQVLRIAAAELEAAPEDLEIVHGQARVRGVPDKAIDLAKLAELSTRYNSRYEPIFGRGASTTRQMAPGFTAHLVEVVADPDTGEVRPTRYVAVQDVGRAINPAGVEGQMHGGAAQGLGWGLYEQLVYDEGGQLLTATLMDYALPTAEMVPAFATRIVEVPAADGPLGARGVGEPPVIPGAAAVANA